MILRTHGGTTGDGWTERDVAAALVAATAAEGANGVLVVEQRPGRAAGATTMFASDRFCEMTGLSAAEVVGAPLRVALAGTELTAAQARRAATAARAGRPVELTTRAHLADGREAEVEILVAPQPGPNGRPARATIVVRDRSESARREREACQILDAADQAVIAIDADFQIRATNERSRRDAPDAVRDSLVGRPLPEGYPLLVGTPVEACLQRVMRTRRSEELEWTCRQSDAVLQVRVTPTAEGAVLLYRDVTDTRRTEESLRHAARHDSLTGLANRATFADHLEQRHRRRSKPAVLLVDIDRFNIVNDTLGYGGGDQLLAEVARRLHAHVRADELLARLDGDEFALCANVDDEAEATVLAQRLRQALSTSPFRVGDKAVTVTVSVGVAVAGPGDTPTSQLRNADAALHAAKEAGRDSVRNFDEHLRSRVGQRLDLEHRLRHAVEARELTVHYQPAWELSSGELHSFEALVRWPRPDGGFEPTATFVSLAEESDLILAVGEQVVEHVAVRASAPHAGRARLWVNLSARELSRGDLADRILSILARHGAPGTAIGVEVTERGLIADQELATANLARLRAAGILVAIDDFGTGYSSLRYVARFAPDVIKIDRCFIQDLAHDRVARSIVQAVVHLARSLGARSLGEGVERAEQLELLGEMGCDLASGYLLGRPAPPHRLRIATPDALRSRAPRRRGDPTPRRLAPAVPASSGPAGSG